MWQLNLHLLVKEPCPKFGAHAPQLGKVKSSHSKNYSYIKFYHYVVCEMSNVQSFEDVLNQAKEKEYKWLDAIETYQKAIEHALKDKNR